MNGKNILELGCQHFLIQISLDLFYLERQTHTIFPLS